MNPSSLPDELNRDDDDDVQEVITREKPIRVDVNERNLPNTEKRIRVGSLLALPMTSLSLLLSVIILVVAVDHPVQKISALFGGKRTPEASEIGDLKTQVDTFATTLAEASHKVDQALNGLRNVTQDMETFRTQISDIEARQTNLENRVIQINSKVEAIAARPTPKPVAAKPKEPVKAPVLVNVVSIRSQGGVAWTSLSEGLDISPLLAVGDEWRSFRVIGIDPAKHDVQVASNGTVTTVKL